MFFLMKFNLESLQSTVSVQIVLLHVTWHLISFGKAMVHCYGERTTSSFTAQSTSYLGFCGLAMTIEDR